MQLHHRNVLLLSAAQGLLLTNNVTLTALSGLVGYQLASDKSLATLPIATQVVGSALTSLPASYLMHRIGRRAGFQVGALLGFIGAAIATYGIHARSMALLCLGTFLLGGYWAFSLFYRFAAADSAPAEFKAKAISLVVAGGIVGAIVGPTLSKWTRNLSSVEFLASFASLMVFCLLTAVLLVWLKIPKPPAAATGEPPRKIRQIAAQPVFIVAVMSSAVGMGVMNFLMTATPLAMGACGHHYDAAADVIAAHVSAMFLPSFFTGSLIKRFTVHKVILAGVAAMFACMAVALAGTTVAHFFVALVFLGVGWNFMWVGGATMLTDAYRPTERARTQGLHDVLVLVTTGTSAFTSGVVLKTDGWHTLAYLTIPFVALTGLAVLWLALRRPTPAAAP